MTHVSVGNADSVELFFGHCKINPMKCGFTEAKSPMEVSDDERKNNYE